MKDPFVQAPQEIGEWFARRTHGLPADFVKMMRETSWQNESIFYPHSLPQDQGFTNKCFAHVAASILDYWGERMDIAELHSLANELAGPWASKKGQSVGAIGTAIEKLTGGKYAAVPFGWEFIGPWLFHVGPFSLQLEWFLGLDQPERSHPNTIRASGPKLGVGHSVMANGYAPDAAVIASGILFWKRKRRAPGLMLQTSLRSAIGRTRPEIVPQGLQHSLRPWPSNGVSFPLKDLNSRTMTAQALGILPAEVLAR